MKYFTIPVTGMLSAYVRFCWVLEGNASENEPYVHRSMADGCCELLFHYKGRFKDILSTGVSQDSVISGIGGPSQQFSRHSIDTDFGIFGVYLYPFAVKALFGIPAHAIANQLPSLHALLGNDGRAIEAKIILANNHLKRVKVISQYLAQKIKKANNQNEAIIFTIKNIIQMHGAVSVETLAQNSFLSTRQFERNFKEYAGFNPKLYTRIIRFQTAMSKYYGKEMSLTSIAHDCGYYDQSHFIHDFKEFSGFHPKTYFSGGNEATTWRDE